MHTTRRLTSLKIVVMLPLGRGDDMRFADVSTASLHATIQEQVCM